jgi:hypothetical protein
MVIKVAGKAKKAQGTMGLSISTLWAIILIIFFIAATFLLIRYFLADKDQAMTALFVNDLDNDVREAFFGSASSSHYFNSTLPANIEYVCFVNFSSAPTGNSIEQGILSHMKESTNWQQNKNLYLYSPKQSLDTEYFYLKYIAFDRNPLCIKTKNGKIAIKIERTTADTRVWLSE